MRCVNLDWLEVYCLESNNRYPCNADYFRRQGYFVREREYGTRQYNEMFTLEDEHGEPMIEIRRNPCAGFSTFAGFLPQSTHIRFVNRYCYMSNCVQIMRDFLLKHEYIFKRIFRIDICYDFHHFDTGDLPERFAHRYLEGKYSKINQCHLSAHGLDNWSDFQWETLSWGSPTSMVSTKLYNKSKELARSAHDKPYIRYCWWECGLITDPVTGVLVDSQGVQSKPDIWRIEFSLRSAADTWLIIEDQSGKRMKKKAIKHTLSMFDSPDKLWQRFEDLAFHYFRFKHFEEGQRKDRCHDKQLFYFSRDRMFAQITQLPRESQPMRDDQILKKRLIVFRSYHSDMTIRNACDEILKYFDRQEARRLTISELNLETRALQEAVRARMQGDERSPLVIIEEVKKLLADKQIF